MYSPSLSTPLQKHRRRQRRTLGACSSTVALPLMPVWFERAIAFTVAGMALLAVVGAALGASA